MHTVRSLVTAVALAAATSAAHATEPVDAGVLTTHVLASLDGAETRLSAYTGDVVVVNFWASWCAPCRKELPMLDAWNREWTNRGARVVAISIDRDVRKARRFAEETKLALTVLHDGPDGLATRLDLPSVPCTYLLDRDGTVVRVVRGSSEKELAALRAHAESLMAARARTVQDAGMGAEAPAGASEGDQR